MKSKSVPRGIRNNNPGNIELTGTRWQGMSDDQDDGRFIQFKSPEWGIRAIARVLITYQDKRQARDGSAIDTVQEFIDRWAPPFENDTSAYAKHVAAQIGRSVDETIDVYDCDVMRGMVTAIILHENGMQPYDDKTIDRGLELAGIAVERDLSKSRTMQAGTAATAAIAGAGIAEEVDAIKVALEPYAAFEWVKYGLLALTLLSVGVMVWARIDDHRRGLR